MVFSCRVYPRFLGPVILGPLTKSRFIVSRRLSTQPEKWSYNNPIRQKIIDEISKNPNFLNQGSVSFSRPRLSWPKRLVYLASSYFVGMGLYLGYQYYQVNKSENENCSKGVFVPLWLGVNWPSQRRLSFPKSLHYMDSESKSELSYDDPQLRQNLQNHHVERQVLDCLFRSSVMRETFKLPINIVDSSAARFDIWVEPHYSTLHGPMFSISKRDGTTSIESAWKVRSIKGTRDVNDFFSGFSSAFESLAFTGAQRNTHDKGSGRIHQATKSPHGESMVLESLSSKSSGYNIAFSGTLAVTDQGKQHTGTVSYTGIIDGSHLGLHEGVLISTMTLEVAEIGKIDTIFKVK